MGRVLKLQDVYMATMPQRFVFGELVGESISTLSSPKTNISKISEVHCKKKLDDIDNLLWWKINSKVSS